MTKNYKAQFHQRETWRENMMKLDEIYTKWMGEHSGTFPTIKQVMAQKVPGLCSQSAIQEASTNWMNYRKELEDARKRTG